LKRGDGGGEFGMAGFGRCERQDWSWRFGREE